MKWTVAMESRSAKGYSHHNHALRYIVTDGSRETVLYGLFPYTRAFMMAWWRNLTSVPTVEQVQRAHRRREVEELHEIAKMKHALQQFDRELLR